MAKKRIGILIGGGDVPGLNAVIKTVTYRSDPPVNVVSPQPRLSPQSGLSYCLKSQGPLLRRHYPASTLLRPCPTPALASAEISRTWRGLRLGLTPYRLDNCHCDGRAKDSDEQ
jgi:hypothetical protein